MTTQPKMAHATAPTKTHQLQPHMLATLDQPDSREAPASTTKGERERERVSFSRQVISAAARVRKQLRSVQSISITVFVRRRLSLIVNLHHSRPPLAPRGAEAKALTCSKRKGGGGRKGKPVSQCQVGGGRWLEGAQNPTTGAAQHSKSKQGLNHGVFSVPKMSMRCVFLSSSPPPP